MIGSCDNCDRQNVPVSSGQFCGCNTTQCFICQGDIADPYGELDEFEPIAFPAYIEQLAEAVAVVLFIAMIAVFAALGVGA